MIPWHEAVQLAMSEKLPVTGPAKQRFYAEALADELVNLWSDLEEQRNHAMDHVWSAGCNWITERIVRLTRLVGPTPWGKIPTTLLLDGTYAGILDQIGVAYERPDLDEVVQVMRESGSIVPGGGPG